MKTTRRPIAVAVSAGLLLLAAGGAQAAAPTTEELLKQIQALQATVQTLQQQVKEQGESLAKAKEALPEGAEVATSDDIAGLKADLEDTKYNIQRQRDYNTALSSRGLTIGGTLKGIYTHSSNPTVAQSNRPYGTAAEYGFSANATLSFAGNLYRDYAEGRNLDYRLAFSFANPKFSNGNANTNTPTQGDSVVKVTDLYLQYSLLRNLGALEDPKLTVTFGQQKIPFGLEAQVSDELKPTVADAQFLTTLPQLGKRQIGVILRGDSAPTVDYGFGYRAPLLEYALGVVNGNGDNTSDDNTRKDWLGRVAFTLPADYNSPWRELKLGTSYYSGWAVLNNAPTSGTPIVLKDAAHAVRKGLDLYYNHNPFGVTYERVDGVDETYLSASQTSSVTKQIRSRGHVATLFFNFGDIAQWSKNLNNVGKYDDYWPTTSQVYLRYDSWDPNVYAPNDKTVKSTVGYNLFFAQTTKLQVGFTHTAYPGQNKVHSNDLTAQFQYGF